MRWRCCRAKVPACADDADPRGWRAAVRHPGRLTSSRWSADPGRRRGTRRRGTRLRERLPHRRGEHHPEPDHAGARPVSHRHHQASRGLDGELLRARRWFSGQLHRHDQRSVPALRSQQRATRQVPPGRREHLLPTGRGGPVLAGVDGVGHQCVRLHRLRLAVGPEPLHHAPQPGGLLRQRRRWGLRQGHRSIGRVPRQCAADRHDGTERHQRTRRRAQQRRGRSFQPHHPQRLRAGTRPVWDDRSGAAVRRVPGARGAPDPGVTRVRVGQRDHDRPGTRAATRRCPTA